MAIKLTADEAVTVDDISKLGAELGGRLGSANG